MLSRIAESLYWIGRYTERAESTARILDVYSHSVLEDRRGEEESACVRLLDALGAGEAAAAVGTEVEALIAFVVDDPRYPGSIAHSLEAAWANARGAREAISSEMWESINTTHATLAARRGGSAFVRHNLLGWVRDRAAIVAGLADASMSHDDGWRFIVLGRTLERVDMTVRLLSTRLGDAWGTEGWVAMLRSCAAYEAYLRTYRRGVVGSRAVEFLLLDRLFPRSVFHALSAAEAVLYDLDPGPARRGTESEARRLVGRACAELEFVRTDELAAGLPQQLGQLERAGTEAHDAIAERFFHRVDCDPVERLMTWRLSVEHVTTYVYLGDVFASYNEARLTPSRDRQLVLDHRVQVNPRVAVMRYLDYWGSEVCAFDVTEPHQRLVVTGRSLVETGAGRRLPTGGDATWARLNADVVRDEFHEYLTSSTFVTCDDPRLVEAARTLAVDRPVDADPDDIVTPAAVVEAACAWTRESLVYEPGATDVSTTASGALDVGRGVCQDFVHVAIALLRACGIPARYASGYLHPHEDAQIGDVVTGQSHAWLEAWLGDWFPVDPTSGVEVGERHVLVARGRDYGDVTPLKGVFHGPPDLSVDVRVAIERVA